MSLSIQQYLFLFCLYSGGYQNMVQLHSSSPNAGSLCLVLLAIVTGM